MMSLRLDSALEERLRRAADAEGVSLSEFFRVAAAARADLVLNDNLVVELGDIIGSVHGTGGSVASRTGEAFTELLVEEYERKLAERSRR